MGLYIGVLVRSFPSSSPQPELTFTKTELKELIAMHSSLSSHGGDLKNDTVTIIGATLDLQEKVVMQVNNVLFPPCDQPILINVMI